MNKILVFGSISLLTVAGASGGIAYSFSRSSFLNEGIEIFVKDSKKLNTEWVELMKRVQNSIKGDSDIKKLKKIWNSFVHSSSLFVYANILDEKEKKTDFDNFKLQIKTTTTDTNKQENIIKEMENSKPLIYKICQLMVKLKNAFNKSDSKMDELADKFDSKLHQYANDSDFKKIYSLAKEFMTNNKKNALSKKLEFSDIDKLREDGAKKQKEIQEVLKTKDFATVDKDLKEFFKEWESIFNLNLELQTLNFLRRYLHDSLFLT